MQKDPSKTIEYLISHTGGLQNRMQKSPRSFMMGAMRRVLVNNREKSFVSQLFPLNMREKNI